MIKRKYLEIDVLQAAKERIIKLFETNEKINLSFSGGKDSIVLADIVYNLLLQEKIDKSKLIVTFIDEEAMYDDVIELTKRWRIKFMQLGVPFYWFAMQYKHYNCLNTLTDEESFICWDETKKDCWVRQKPPFAIEHHELFIDRGENYQSFIIRFDRVYGYIGITGVRVSDSAQRLMNIASMKTALNSKSQTALPLYDWEDSDIWLYIRKFNIDIPSVYENMYRIGVPTNRLRISQFFSIDTAKCLVSMSELYPDLMARVIKREPNAYLCSLYWDTEMFGKSTRAKKKLEDEQKDYRKLVYELFLHPNPNFTQRQKEMCKIFKSLVINNSLKVDDYIYKRIYACIISGDPKKRTQRAIMLELKQAYSKEAIDEWKIETYCNQ